MCDDGAGFSLDGVIKLLSYDKTNSLLGPINKWKDNSNSFVLFGVIFLNQEQSAIFKNNLQ